MPKEKAREREESQPEDGCAAQATRGAVRGTPARREDFKARGHVTTEYTFWCGQCEQWEQLPSDGTLKRTEAAAREIYHWSYDRALGWLCPYHTKQKRKRIAAGGARSALPPDPLPKLAEVLEAQRKRRARSPGAFKHPKT